MSEQRVKVITTDEEFKIFVDPYRMRILEVYNDEKTPLTVKQVADILGEVPAKVHYHIKKLIKIGILELDHIEIINGINAKYYKLMFDEFRLDASQTSPKLKNIQIDVAMNVIIQTLDRFKEIVLKRAEEVKTEEETPEEDGFMSLATMYMNPEEYNNLQNDLRELTKKYAIKDESKLRYSLITGLMKNTREGK